MGSNLLSSEMAAGNSTDPIESQNPNTATRTERDQSAWRVEEESNDEDDTLAPEENPYAERRIGRRPTEVVRAGRNKCALCGKGFNSRSTFIACHACDKPTHIRCIKDTFNEDQYMCQKCSPTTNQSAPVVDNTTEEVIVNEEETIVQELVIQDNVIPAVEQQTQVRIESVRDLLKKLNLGHLA